MPKFDSLPVPDSQKRIVPLDYNEIRNKIASILGSGSGQRGYGQTVASSAVFSGNNITKAQWDLLRYDIINAKIHQDGGLPSIIEASGYIGYGPGFPNINYDTISEQAITDKFSIGDGQSVLSSAISQERTGSWSTQSQCTLTVTFANADEARYFFNSGGKLRFTSTLSGGTTTSQYNAWYNLLNTTIGTINFGAITPVIVNFYTLTTAYQTVYQTTASSPYSANYYAIEALCNCTDPTNVNGTASTITFRVTWRDDYTDIDVLSPPYDTVNGTLKIQIDEVKASGSMLPSGSFSITSPGYSISSITAS
jgi:hypothetical protein